MKIAITGKGGVGKTTLTSLLAYAYADKGFQVLAIDADPSPCLAGALAFPQELLDALTPIARMDDLIYERTGAQPGTTGGYFKLNPRVDDIPDRFSAVHRGIRLLEMGAVELGETFEFPAPGPRWARGREITNRPTPPRVKLDLWKPSIPRLDHGVRVDGALDVLLDPAHERLGELRQTRRFGQDVPVLVAGG